MAKKPTKAEINAYLKAIQENVIDDKESTHKEVLDSLHNIEATLKKDASVQASALETSNSIEHLAEQDRVLQIAQDAGEYLLHKDAKESLEQQTKIIKDEDESLNVLKDIKSLLETMSKSIVGSKNPNVENESSITNDKIFNSTASNLIPTSEYIKEDKALAKQERKNRSSATKTLDFFDKTGIVKRGSTGIFARMYGLPKVAKQEEKEKYIAREREFGSTETDEKLGLNFNELQTAQRKKSLAQKELETKKTNLNLTDKQVANTKSGKDLLDQISKLDDLIQDLDSSIKGKDKTPDDSDHEEQLETKKIQEEQSTLLEKIEENTRPRELPQQAVRNEPAPQVSESVDTSSGIGLKDIGKGIKSAGKTVLNAGKSVLNVGKNVISGGLRTAGGLIESAAGSSAGAIAMPIAGAAAAGYALHKGAEAFSESFGEGGFDLIQKLRKSDAISYGWDTTPEVDDWKQIEALEPKDLQTLIDTKEFEGEDLKKIQDILAKKSTSTTVNPNQVVNNSGTDYILKPGAEKASQVYNQSADNSQQAMMPTATNNTVVAPTTVNNSTVNKQNIRLPVRNGDDTQRRYVSSRYTN